MDVGERAAAAAPPQQPHRFGGGGGVGGSEFFICFTSRPSSSSMRIPSSKSLPSPGRTDKYHRDAASAGPSLSASLSRRLKSSGSVKGGQSPATIPAVGGSRKKSSCPFEAAEPSSPKVTCIGQVKVKTARMKKKKGTALRSASKRGSKGVGEATFRRFEQKGAGGDAGEIGGDRECLPNRNQRWVHLPLSSICDALREFNCFLPCGGGGRSHCSSAEKGGRRGEAGGGTRVGEKRARGGGIGSCGAAFARWLMAVQESEGVRRGDVVELVVGEVEGGRGMAREISGMEVLMDAEKGGLVMREEKVEMQGAALAAAAAAALAEDDGEPVCVPPPNALLLMRCRSDPVRMAALANKFWGSPAPARVEVEEDEEEDHDEDNEADDGKEGPDRHAAQNGEEQKEAAGQRQESVAAAIAAEAVLKEDRIESRSDKTSGICVQDVEGEEGKMPLLQGVEETQMKQQRREEKGERGVGSQHRAEATPQVGKSLQEEEEEEEEEEEGPKLEEAAAANKEDAGLTGSRYEPHLQAREQEEEAGKEEMPSKARRSTSFSLERQGRRTSFSSEREDGRKCFSKEKEGRRHSFSTEKEARRSSSFRDNKEGRRSSFSVEGDGLRPSFCTEGEGRRRWSFSSEKEAKVAAVMGLAAAGEKKRKKKKKKEGYDAEGEEQGATIEEDSGVEARSFERPSTTMAATPPAEGEGEVGRRAEKRNELPDCLLLMMYEPKLSMEVSRETWVCTSDFLRCRPPHHRQQQPQHHQPNTAQGEEAPAADAIDRDAGESKVAASASKDTAPSTHPSPPPPPPPPPAPPAAPARDATPPPRETAKPKAATPASAGVGALAAAASSPYAPFGLTRCKSEPMRSSAKLEPDACFWKSRHQPIGAAGIGF